MRKTLKQRMSNEKGLTLVEVLAVVVIIGIVASMAIPAVGNIVEKSRGKTLVIDTINVMNAAKLYYLDTGETKKVTLQNLKDANYLQSQGRLTSAEIYFDEMESLRIKATAVNSNVTLDTVATGITYEDLVSADISIIDGQVILTGPNGDIYN